MSNIHIKRRSPWVSRSLIFSAIALCGACAGPSTRILEEARQEYTLARQDPEIEHHAPAAILEAQRSLRQAEQAASEHKMEQMEHWAYLTKQQVQIARTETEQQTTQAQATAEATSEVQQLTRELAELNAKKTARGYVITLGDVLFNTGQASLTPGAQQNLHQLVMFLMEHPEQTVLIEGHTDSMGSDAYNLDLSQRRAWAVQDFLLKNGIGPERIMARGYGESMPMASNDTAAGRQLNRRVEIILPPGIAGR